MQKFDFLVIGSGIAGLSYALKVANHGSVCIITKSNDDESNTKYAQGGIATVTDHLKDSFLKHISDTINCGDGLCNEEIVRIVIEEGPDRVKEIIQWGADFDKMEDGSYDLAREGGHSEHRVLHHKDITGFEIERALLNQIYQNPNITLYTHMFAIDLITEHHLGKIINKSTKEISCFGIYTLDTKTNKIETILGKQIMLGTGGAGQVYAATTNPIIATGDGMAMAYRAKARLENMEFIQFHPTALYNPGEHPSFLISEAVRGYGGILKTTDGKPFMRKYDSRESLASRDIVARAIDNELKKRGDDFVYLDCRHIPEHIMLSHFPNIYQKCMRLGMNMKTQMIPVVPAQHYMVGGVKVDTYGRTSIKNLYACGESSSTGLHGANRLASNSLLEALVFSHRISIASTTEVKNVEYNLSIPDWNDEGTSDPKELVLITQSIKELQSIMSNYVGIVRTNARLERANDRLALIFKEMELLYNHSKLSVKLLELRNLVQVAYCIVKSAKLRTESLGLHFNTDYPEKAINSQKTII